MDLDLTRVDYIQVGLTHPKCAKLLPSAGIKAQQKVRFYEEGYLSIYDVTQIIITST